MIESTRKCATWIHLTIFAISVVFVLTFIFTTFSAVGQNYSGCSYSNTHYGCKVSINEYSCTYINISCPNITSCHTTSNVYCPVAIGKNSYTIALKVLVFGGIAFGLVALICIVCFDQYKKELMEERQSLNTRIDDL